MTLKKALSYQKKLTRPRFSTYEWEPVDGISPSGLNFGGYVTLKTKVQWFTSLELLLTCELTKADMQATDWMISDET